MSISKSPQHIMNGQGQLVGINAERPAAIAAWTAYWEKWAKIPSWKPTPLKDTIGVGIITCNREKFLKKCLASLPRHKFHQIVLVNDGDSADFKDKSNMSPRRYVYSKNQLMGSYFYTGGGRSVGFAKNWAIKELMKFGRSVELAQWPGDQQSVEHFFLIEDDIIIKDENVFEKAQGIINANRHSKGNVISRKKKVYVLSGIIKCGDCEGEEKVKTTSGTSKTGRQYHYYKCVKCDNTVRAKKLESAVKKQLAELATDKDFIKILVV